MIFFNKPYLTGKELPNIEQALDTGELSGEKSFCKKAASWLEAHLGCPKVILTPSCTSALEMAVHLIDVAPGDEIIVPSFTFSSTATAIVMANAVPVFVDCGEDMNIDADAVERAITPKTKAIMVVHYGAVACDMERILDIASRHKLYVIEDAAQCMFATYRGRPLGTFGDFGCFSFHETKNISCGEGGALAVNNPAFVERAEIMRDKGTNRAQFFRGQSDKYSWHDKGSSYLLGNVPAAHLLAQLEYGEEITERRREIWHRYFNGLKSLAEIGVGFIPETENGKRHNGHLFALFARTTEECGNLISYLNERGIQATFHYIPLHSAPAGRKYGRVSGAMTVTDDRALRLVRLPLHMHLAGEGVEEICKAIMVFYGYGRDGIDCKDIGL